MSFGLRDVTVRFGPRTALAGVSVEVGRGEVAAVVGGDGAGKTTAMRVLVGAIAPGAGDVRRPARREIGYLPATSGVYADLTVTENLAFVGAVFGSGRGDAAALLARTGLGAVGDRLAGRLSGGMRRKLALVLAIVHHPALLVLDEPTTGVDPVSRAELWRLIAAAAAGGAAVILTTTYVEEAQRAGRVLVLDEGRALAAGAPAEVIAAIPGRVGRTPARPAPDVRWSAWRRGAGWRVWSPADALPDFAETIAPDLEDAVTIAALRAERKAAR